MRKKQCALLGILYFIAALAYNIYLFDRQKGMFNAENLPPIVGIGASLCALLLAAFSLRFQQIKERKAKQEQ